MQNETWKLLGLFALTLGVIALAGRTLRLRYASDIRLIFFFFGLSAVLTALIGILAIYTGGIDSKGQFQGMIGGAVSWLLNEALAINHGIAAFSALACLITIPQVISYILSGLFGVGSTPLFTETSVDLITFAVIKSTTIAAGALVSASILGEVQNWDGWSLRGMLAMQALALMLLMISFVTALYYREAAEFGLFSRNLSKPRSKNPVALFHRLMTRKQSRKGNGIWDA